MDLERFLEAQQNTYSDAFEEIKAGRKQTHWMWFIFPQLKGLGRSPMANHYGINDVKEAMQYLNHSVLGGRLVEIASALLFLQGSTASEVFGYPDDLKLHSCMTLFSRMPNANPVFQQVLDKYFYGKPDERTLQMVNNFNQK